MNAKELLARVGFKVDDKPLTKAVGKLKDFKKAIGNIGGKNVDAVNQQMQSMRGSLNLLAGAEVVKGIYHLAQSFSDMTDKIRDNASALGLSTKEFQQLGYAAQKSGVSQDEMGAALSHLSENIQGARMGSLEAIKAFQAFGIDSSQIATFNNSSDALNAMMGRLKAIKDPILQRSAEMKLFGTTNADMSKFLNQSASALKGFKEEADSKGGVIADEDLTKLKQFQITAGLLSTRLTNMATHIIAQVAPAFDFLTGRFLSFLDDNKLFLNTSFESWAESAAYYIGYVIGFVGALASKIIAFAKEHQPLVNMLGRVAAAAALVIVPFASLSLVWSGLSKLFGPTLGLFANVAQAALKLSWAMAKKLGPAMLGLARKAFPATMTLLEGLATAIYSALAPFAPFIAAVTAVVLTVQALWQIMHGKSFWDTWIGEMLTSISKLGPKILKFLGLLPEDVENLSDLWSTKKATDIGSDASVAVAKRTQKDDLLDERVSLAGRRADPNDWQFYKAPQNSAMNVQSLMTTTPQTQTSVSAPVNITVNGASDPSATAQKVKDAISGHMNTVLRNTQVSTASGVAY